MSQTFVASRQSWASALRLLVGYPAFAPIRDTVAFSAGGPSDSVDDQHVAKAAAEMQRDLVCLTFRTDDAREPSKICMAVLLAKGAEWLAGARLYAANRSAPLELIHGDKRWRIDERNQLVSRKLPARRLLTRGEQIAWCRLRRKVEELERMALKRRKATASCQAELDAPGTTDFQIAA